MTVTVPKDVLLELMYRKPGESVDGVTLVCEEEIDTGRWTSHNRLIIETDAGYYEAEFEAGLTEMQSMEPFEDAPVDVPVKQVWPHVVHTTVWKHEPASTVR